MHDVSLLEDAVMEAQEAAYWYETQRAGLGREFRQALKQSLEILREGIVTGIPWPGALGERGVKRIPMKRFPYNVVFAAIDENIVVLAVAHQRRRPGYWRHRVK